MNIFIYLVGHKYQILIIFLFYSEHPNLAEKESIEYKYPVLRKFTSISSVKIHDMRLYCFFCVSAIIIFSIRLNSEFLNFFENLRSFLFESF